MLMLSSPFQVISIQLSKTKSLDNAILELYWFSYHGIWAIYHALERVCSKLKQTENRLYLQIKSGRILDIFNKTIIPLTFVGYGMIIANSALVRRLVGYLSRILYPTRTRGIIVKYVLHLDLYVARFFYFF